MKRKYSRMSRKGPDKRRGILYRQEDPSGAFRKLPDTRKVAKDFRKLSDSTWFILSNRGKARFCYIFSFAYLLTLQPNRRARCPTRARRVPVVLGPVSFPHFIIT